MNELTSVAYPCGIPLGVFRGWLVLRSQPRKTPKGMPQGEAIEARASPGRGAEGSPSGMTGRGTGEVTRTSA